MLMRRLLAGMKVLDVAGDSIANSYASRVLTMMGADVTVGEVTGSDGRERVLGHKAAGDEVMAGLPLRRIASGKRRLVADPTMEEGRRALEGCAETVDVVLLSGRGGDPVTPDWIGDRCSSIVTSPFGQYGPRSDWMASAFGLFHAAGLGSVTPRAPREGTSEEVRPMAPYGHFAEYYCGISIAAAAVACRLAPTVQRLEISLQECLIPLMRRELAAWRYEAYLANRRERLWQVAPSGLYPAKDGAVYVSVIEDSQWQALCSLIGQGSLTLDPRFKTPQLRFRNARALDESVAPWFADRDRHDIFIKCGEAGIPVGAVYGPIDLKNEQHVRSRKVFEHAADPGSGFANIPIRIENGLVKKSDPNDIGLKNSAQRPSRDASRARIVRETSLSEPGSDQRDLSVGDDERNLLNVGALQGLRVIEFTHVWAGPYCGQLLADMGAEVIKIESLERVDVHRRAGPYVDQQAGINRSGVWNAQNRGKRSCAINLRTHRGIDLALELASKSDIVIDNFSPGTLARRGLSFEDISKANPNIVYVSLSGYGLDGPWRDFPAYGPMMDAVSGLSWALRDENGVPQSMNGWFPDTSAAAYAACAALAGLENVRQGGSGLHFDISELESAVSLIPEVIAMSLELNQNADVHANEIPGVFASGVYQCLDGGWVALVLRSRQEYERLVKLCDMASTNDSRVDSVVDLLERLFAVHRQEDVCQTLQENHIECVPVMTAKDLDEDSHLNQRGSFFDVQHEEVGQMRVYGPTIRVAGENPSPTRAAPVLGEANQYVLGEILGLDGASIRQMEDEGILV